MVWSHSPHEEHVWRCAGRTIRMAEEHPHWKGIRESIIDLCATVPVHFVIADGIVAMEGNGPLNGAARTLKTIVLADVASAIRSPRGARPHSRVISVVTPLSSKNISFSGASLRRVSRNACRRCWLTCVSRSRAWSDFFSIAVPSCPTPSRARTP